MRLAPALLEEWMRRFYFETDFDIGSSGVEDFSMADLRRLVGLTHDDLDAVVFHDSQTLGGSGLRRAIGERLAGGHGERVMVTHGSTDANFMIMQALLEPGDEVVVLDPCYQQLYGVAAAMGCRLRHWPLRFERGWRPDFDELAATLTPSTRMVVVNFPHNPTGVSLRREEQAKLIAAVERVGAYLVWDGAFGELTYEGAPLPLPLDYDRALSMGTLSKAYGLPGLRVGWCIASPELLARLARIRDYTTLHLSPLVEMIAERAIDHADRLVSLRLEQARSNRAVVAKWVAAQAGALEWVPPEGGVASFVRFVDRDVDALCLRLAREQRVLLVPGSCFEEPQFARLGFGCSPESLREGLSRVSHLLEIADGATVGQGGAERLAGLGSQKI
jgi:capreomycidine synthase